MGAVGKSSVNERSPYFTGIRDSGSDNISWKEFVSVGEKYNADPYDLRDAVLDMESDGIRVDKQDLIDAIINRDIDYNPYKKVETKTSDNSKKSSTKKPVKEISKTSVLEAGRAHSWSQISKLIENQSKGTILYEPGDAQIGKNPRWKKMDDSPNGKWKSLGNNYMKGVEYTTQQLIRYFYDGEYEE